MRKNKDIHASGNDFPEAPFYDLEENDSAGSGSQSNDSYNLEEEEHAGEKELDSNANRPPKQHSPIAILLSLMTNPTDGWKKLRRSPFSPEEMASRCLYPLCAMAALSKFADLIYPGDATISGSLIGALIIFMSFFFGYFIIGPIAKILLPKDTKAFTETPFAKKFFMAMLSSLAIFLTVYECVPMLQPILVFLPLWTIYLISKGSRFVKATQSKPTAVAGILSIVTIGSPLLIYWLFDIVLP